MNQFDTATFDSLQLVPTAAAPSAAARTVALMDLTDAYASAADVPRTTAAGLDAWMSRSDEAQAESEPVPVNVAESLALNAPAFAMRINGANGSHLVIDPERNAYYFASTSLKPLADLLQQQAATMQPIYSAALNTAREGTAQSLARLRWFAGLVATPGNLARGLASDGRYKLARWQETEREFPKHFRIAKAMMKEPMTPDAISEAAKVPLVDVIDYINASQAAGRLETAQVSPRPAETAQAPSRTSALIAKLNKPLFAR
jgi:hypothetical protein